MNEFDLTFPKTWVGNPIIKAVFSKRSLQWNPSREIKGLNLSVSTHDDRFVVLENRKIFFESLGLNDSIVARGKQIHSNIVHTVKEGGIHADGDGFVTHIRGIAVSVLVADCAAILLADDEAGVVGALHAGWRGTVSRIVDEGISAMRVLGAKPERIKAYVSPCISEACFEVGDEVAVQFPSQFVDKSHPKPHVNIRGYLHAQLIENGIDPSHIEHDTACTYADDAYHSYRRDGEKSGRMMAIIWISKGPRS
jgi:polyphenol oxidase